MEMSLSLRKPRNYGVDLVMPQNCVSLDNEEMEYVDGGISAKLHYTSIGFNIDLFLNSTETNKLIVGGGSALGLAAAAANFIPVPGAAQIVSGVLTTAAVAYSGILGWYNADGSGVIITCRYIGNPNCYVPLNTTVEDR